jgi:hypothetical protein
MPMDRGSTKKIELAPARAPSPRPPPPLHATHYPQVCKVHKSLNPMEQKEKG